MTVWDELKVVLARLRDEQPGTLQMYPDPSHDDDRQPPFVIHLAATAADVAAELHSRFGDGVALTVGALPYPPGSPPANPLLRRHAPGSPAELLDPAQATAELDGPAVVRSGDTLHHGLLLHNHSDGEVAVPTNGQLTTAVVDPATGEVVGGFAGAQTLPLIIFRAGPGETVRIPLLTGTASFAPRLGYVVPPGEWAIEATLALGESPAGPPRRRTPPLPLTITP